MPKEIPVPDGTNGHIEDLKELQDYAVTFEANGTNDGTTSVAVGWIPRPGTNPADLPSDVAQVPPNGIFNHPDPAKPAPKVPSRVKAYRLEIKVQKPGNTGELRVTQGDVTWV